MAIATEDFIKQIDEMSVLELNNLVKALEEHYGVSAAAAAMPMAVAGAGAAAAVAEEQTEFDVVLTASATRRSTSSRPSARSRASASRTPRTWSSPPRDDQGSRLQGRGRGDQEEVRGSRRRGRDQVTEVASSVLARCCGPRVESRRSRRSHAPGHRLREARAAVVWSSVHGAAGARPPSGSCRFRFRTGLGPRGLES